MEREEILDKNLQEYPKPGTTIFGAILNCTYVISKIQCAKGRLKFEFKFEISCAGGEIPTLEEVELFEDSSLFF